MRYLQNRGRISAHLHVPTFWKLNWSSIYFDGRVSIRGYSYVHLSSTIIRGRFRALLMFIPDYSFVIRMESNFDCR
jgi:hypothetical protein